jgi:glycosyltransferase involved in cell wall biosynthesis
MTEPALSVVVPCVNGFPYIGRCLEALAEHAPEAEVVVADSTDEETRRRLRQDWPQVRLLPMEEPTPVPLLRAAAIAAARAPHVAVIEDHCVVTEDWASRILAAHAGGHEVVGGSVRNGATERVRDWAAFFCEYTGHMEPAPAGVVASLPGMNVSYGRAPVSAMGDFLERGLWETWLHPHLQHAGFELWSDPELVILHVKDFGIGDFLAQRYHFARSYAGLRNPELGWKRLLYCLGSPLLVPLVSYRIVRNVLARGRHRRELLLASPLVVLYAAAWAWGEMVGYALGGGRSLLRVK